MDLSPDHIQGVDERLIPLIRHLDSSMPPGAPAQEMQDNVLVHEEEITLHLLVEAVGNVDTADVTGSWLGPHPTDPTSLHYLRDEIQHLLSHSNSLEKALHDERRGMPPTDMKLTERLAVIAYTACSEEANNFADVKAAPV